MNDSSWVRMKEHRVEVYHLFATQQLRSVVEWLQGQEGYLEPHFVEKIVLEWLIESYAGGDALVKTFCITAISIVVLLNFTEDVEERSKGGWIRRELSRLDASTRKVVFF